MKKRGVLADRLVQRVLSIGGQEVAEDLWGVCVSLAALNRSTSATQWMREATLDVMRRKRPRDTLRRWTETRDGYAALAELE